VVGTVAGTCDFLSAGVDYDGGEDPIGILQTGQWRVAVLLNPVVMLLGKHGTH